MTRNTTRRTAFTGTVQPAPCDGCGRNMTGVPDVDGAWLCRQCYDLAGIENKHADGYHNDEPHADCPTCKTTLNERPTAQKDTAMTTTETKASTAIEALAAAAKVAAEAHKAAIEALTAAKEALKEAKAAAIEANAALREARAAAAADKAE